MGEVETRLKNQIADEARKRRSGSFTYPFGRPYNMTGVVFNIGDTLISGVFSGRVKEQHGLLSIEGSFEFSLEDEFADPLDIGIKAGGESYAPTFAPCQNTCPAPARWRKPLAWVQGLMVLGIAHKRSIDWAGWPDTAAPVHMAGLESRPALQNMLPTISSAPLRAIPSVLFGLPRPPDLIITSKATR